MSCAILAGATLGLAALAALAAWLIARRIGRAAEGPDFWAILLAIVLALAVLQGASRLPVVVAQALARLGQDPATACGGKLAASSFVALLVVTTAFVLGFLASFRRARRGQGGEG